MGVAVPVRRVSSAVIDAPHLIIYAMTIRGLQNALRGCVHRMPAGSFAGQTIAVDATLLVHQMTRVRTREGAIIMNARGEPIQHIQGMLFRTIGMLETGSRPVFVFDGEPPKAKAETLEQRRERRTTPGPDAAVYADTEQLLDLLGVQHIRASSEAEALCAKMNARGDAAAVATDDLDALVFGATRVVREYGREREVLVYDAEAIFAALEITRDQFVDACVIAGGDYHEGARVPTRRAAKTTAQDEKPARAKADGNDDADAAANAAADARCVSFTAAVRAVRQHGSGAAAIRAGEFEMPDFAETRRLYARPSARTASHPRVRRANPKALEEWLLSRGLDVKRVRSAVARLQLLADRGAAA
jgi:hypothetical protein